MGTLVLGRASAKAMVSTTSEDFPDPDTPHTPTCTPRGIPTSRPRRLFSRAPATIIHSVGGRRLLRRGMETRRSSTARVTDSALVGTKTRPPARPGPGPNADTTAAAWGAGG